MAKKVLIKNASCWQCFEKRQLQPGHFLCEPWWGYHPRWAKKVERGELDLIFDNNRWLLVRW